MANIPSFSSRHLYKYSIGSLRFGSGSLSSSSQYKDKGVREFWSEDVSIDLNSAIPIRYFQPITDDFDTAVYWYALWK